MRTYLLGGVVVLVVEVSAEGHVHRQVRPRQLLHPLADLPLLLLHLVHLSTVAVAVAVGGTVTAEVGVSGTLRLRLRLRLR